MNRKERRASPAFLPLIRSTTLRAFLGAILAYLKMALASIYQPFTVVVFAAEPEWPLKVLVGENSPSLCPTIFSVTYTGINFLPLCTAKVNPMNSGSMTERLDHVLTSFFSPDEAISFTFFISFSSTNGPFFNDRGNLLPPLYNIHVCPLTVPCLYTLGYAPWG